MNTPQTIPSLADRLLRWFDDHGRHDLPWQENISPYRVWISEIMLQQTQVKTVIPYFERFMTRFPNVEDLANAPEDEVLHLWSGLGYYARARNLHNAAKQIVADHGGHFPAALDDIVALPGIGQSTAGAILSIALNQRQPILDGNVKRVLARLHCVEGFISEAATLNAMWDLAERYTPHNRIADYTQAIMDLGATICTRTKPLCGECPLSSDCCARKGNIQAQYPARKKKSKTPVRSSVFLIASTSEKQVLLNKRPPSGIWGGLWSLPELGDSTQNSLADIDQWCAQNDLSLIGKPMALDEMHHTFTHFKLRIVPMLLKVASKNERIMDSDGLLWYNIANPPPIGLPKPVATLLDNLKQDFAD